MNKKKYNIKVKIRKIFKTNGNHYILYQHDMCRVLILKYYFLENRITDRNFWILYFIFFFVFYDFSFHYTTDA